jgi:ankyrin repeat protein
LVDKGANIHAQDKGGYTALMLAASNNHVDVVGWLIQRGADVNHIEQTQGLVSLDMGSESGAQRYGAAATGSRR